MSHSLSFVIEGEPQGARRHRVDTRRGKVQTFHEDKHEVAEARVIYAARRAMADSGWPAMYDGPVDVIIRSYHRRPKRLCRKKDRNTGCIPYVGKPDADNIAKLVLDGLTKAGAWKDDTRAWRVLVERRYVSLGIAGHQEPEFVLVILETTGSEG